MNLFIATPVYGSLATDYVHSLLLSAPALEKAGHTVQWKTHEGCCYVHISRNKLVEEFLNSNCDELIFIDSDIGWDPQDLVNLVAIDKDIVGGAIPYRMGKLAFPVAYYKAEDGTPMGELETGLIDCNVIPTAMLKIKKDVFFRMIGGGLAEKRVEYSASDGMEGGRWRSFFDFETDNVNHLEFGEDVTFCRKALKLGYHLWCYPNMTLRHHGGGFRLGNMDKYLRSCPGGSDYVEDKNPSTPIEMSGG